MKYLNKVIFVNSASMRYKEIALDGNIHLAGLPGAGKTTVLRGILYFFTADQTHLGIDSNKVNFNQYYFPLINSHIVYEFKKDNESFTVILTKDNHNRIQYSFIDAPYSKEWLVDPVTGSTASSWSEITKNIPQYIDRDLVITIKDYLNIIWGCHPDKRYARYSMAICKGYGDILRSQKNVFLSSGFSASGFKSTIVKSQSGVAPSINLQQLRNRLADYNNEVKDMAVWQKIVRKVDCPARLWSDSIISDYYKHIESEREIRNVLGQLQYAIQKYDEVFPLMEKRREELLSQIEKLENEINSIDERISAESQKLTGDIAVKEKDLKEICSLKMKYKDIENIRREISALPVLEEESKSLKDKLNTLRNENQEIENKYKQLGLELRESHQNILGLITDAVTTRQNEDNNKKKELSEKRDDLRQKAEESYNEQYRYIEGLLEGLREKEKAKIKIQAELEAISLYTEEIRAAEDKISALKNEITTIKTSISLEKEKCRRKEQEALDEEQKIRNAYESAYRDAEEKKGELNNKLQEIEAVISRYDNTLYAWLEENKKEWKDTIGKVIDESVLYRTDLHPSQTDSGKDNTMYGIVLKTDVISERPFTPADYEKRKGLLEKEIHSIDQSIRDKAVERNNQIEANKELYTKDLRIIREEIAKLELQENLNSTNIEKAKDKIKGLKEKANIEKRQRLDMIRVELNELLNDIAEKKQQLSLLNVERGEKLKGIDSNYHTEINKIDSLFEIFKKDRETEELAEIEKYNTQKKEYEKQKQEVLAGNGVDVSKITALDKNLESIEKKISSLKKKSLFIHDYEKDNSEKIVHEQEWLLELQELKRHLEHLYQQYQDEKKKKKANFKLLTDESDKLTEKINEMSKGIEEYNRRKKHFTSIESDLHITQQETTKTILNLLEEYNDIRTNKQECMTDLRKIIKQFKGIFSTNLFNLPTVFEVDEDYIKYAKELSEIISLNTVKVFCEGKKDNYIKTLQGIRMSMDGMKIEMENIKGTIDDIDREFRNARLPEVVQEIRVRHADTKDELYDCLTNIKEFMKVNEGILPGVDFWTSQDEFDKVRDKMEDLLTSFVKILFKAGVKERNEFTLEDMFQIEFKVTENGNSSGWETGIHGIYGSNGTDLMIKMMLNIMLISKSIKKNLKDADLFFHCIVDESENIHAASMRNVIDFCTERNIYLILGSPMTIDPQQFKYNYELYKDNEHHTHIQLLIGKE